MLLFVFCLLFFFFPPHLFKKRKPYSFTLTQLHTGIRGSTKSLTLSLLSLAVPTAQHPLKARFLSPRNFLSPEPCSLYLKHCPILHIPPSSFRSSDAAQSDFCSATPTTTPAPQHTSSTRGRKLSG